MRMRAACLLLAAFAAFPACAQADLAKLLRQGGHVLYMRHTSTDLSQNDSRMRGYDDCANQRNLTDMGRTEARAVAAHVKRLGIPIGKVLAGPPYLAEGEIAVLRPEGESRFAVVGRIRLEDWQALQ